MAPLLVPCFSSNREETRGNEFLQELTVAFLFFPEQTLDDQSTPTTSGQGTLPTTDLRCRRMPLDPRTCRDQPFQGLTTNTHETRAHRTCAIGFRFIDTQKNLRITIQTLPRFIARTNRNGDDSIVLNFARQQIRLAPASIRTVLL